MVFRFKVYGSQFMVDLRKNKVLNNKKISILKFHDSGLAMNLI
jgi:hypothetical protein